MHILLESLKTITLHIIFRCFIRNDSISYETSISKLFICNLIENGFCSKHNLFIKLASVKCNPTAFSHTNLYGKITFVQFHEIRCNTRRIRQYTQVGNVDVDIIMKILSLLLLYEKNSIDLFFCTGNRFNYKFWKDSANQGSTKQTCELSEIFLL